MTISLNDLEIMTFPEASIRWNKERTYVTQQYMKYRDRFLEGSTAAVGYGSKKTYLITKAGMEYLMNETEEEANQGLWLVRCYKDWTYITFEKKVDSEAESKLLIEQLISKDSRNKNHEIVFDVFQDNPRKVRVTLEKNIIYVYEKIKKRRD
ncbi:helix-turn-helix domain-containing protein [Enterococcus sp. AZ196]|uniref:helix-turn-helix domain-containing protein n=1 Tax=Enterococcus sp. AZ196 TaxID=2774659 RepID=UPI003D2B9A4C